ncbi:unnamed protein product [Didymodactylos carnosus]|uniref:Beta-mannosidase Ig-fold domain-containing protein n=3 Tax=Didymodactylos carnosus TaxID=1234261 RepID=A0A8S2RT75_9BILA|nr:unnamed protein product [Didymodactylos carnosus]CAF4168385.1 unnamed protein product [Didymodactylos carnosus]
MYQPTYVLPVLEPYLTYDETSKIVVYLINDGNGKNETDETSITIQCAVHDFEQFNPRTKFIFMATIKEQMMDTQVIYQVPYQKLIQRAKCQNETQCLFRCSYLSDMNDTNDAYEQYLLFTHPKSYKLQDPQLSIVSVTTRTADMMSFDIKIQVERPALFVWLDIVGVKGRFNHNGFHLFEHEKIVTYYTWMPSTVEDIKNKLLFTTLYDLTM